MFRLTVLLCLGLFVTLLIAGEDKGQLRPGLAAAVAAGEEIVVLERRSAPAAVVRAPEPEPALAGAAPVAKPVAETASYTPPPEPQVARKVTPEPVFTLSALPTTTMDPAAEAPAPEAAAEPAPTALAGDVWYVIVDTVNVREGPSTDTSVVEKLTWGEAVTISFEPGSEWAHVRIEGDGLEGYVALRFLSPAAP